MRDAVLEESLLLWCLLFSFRAGKSDGVLLEAENAFERRNVQMASQVNEYIFNK